MKSIVVIPARNEFSTIGDIVKKLKKITSCDVVVVDDASDDNTIENARESGAIILQLSIQLGAWGAIRTGFRYALDNKYEYVLTMDADGQHFAESIPTILAKIQSSNCDVIIGSSIQRGNKYKRLVWFIFRKLSFLNVIDLTSGLRAYNRSAVKTLLTNDTVLYNYQDIAVLLKLKNKGFHISEIPVKMSSRNIGNSKIFYSWFAVLRYIFFTAIMCLISINNKK
ncbi:Glycosyl transferase, family 2 [Candidatus Magnetomorum sp. HK-1]|nr:Glycosyl transferase, family 2 [Candidatus Magnetomorum sp. HK-1]